MNAELATQYEIVAGFFLPPLLSVILQRRWSRATKSYVSFLAVLVTAAGAAYFQNRLDGGDWLHSLFTVLTATIVCFKALWQPTGIAGSIEAKTSLGGE